jgi:hypothetical protein
MLIAAFGEARRHASPVATMIARGNRIDAPSDYHRAQDHGDGAGADMICAWGAGNTAGVEAQRTMATGGALNAGGKLRRSLPAHGMGVPRLVLPK